MTAHPIKWGAPTVGQRHNIQEPRRHLGDNREKEIFEFGGWIGGDFS
jgi:hypothetical protein